MGTEWEEKPVTPSQPSPHREAYEIKVGGRLDESWSEWFCGMSITRQDGCDGSLMTTLTGLVPDQAALRGILSKIWDLNLSLVSVTQFDARLGDEAQAKSDGGCQRSAAT